MRECLKFLIVGDRGVGKSALTQRLCYDRFTGEHKQTVGFDLYRRSFQITDSLEAEIEIWDLAGDSCNSKMFGNYLKSVNAVLMVYDTTNRATLQYLTEWHRRILAATSESGGNPGTSTPSKFVVIGNKTDLVRNRQVTLEDHKRMVEQLSAAAGYFCSAKMNEGINAAYRFTAASLLGIDSKTVEDKTVFKAIVISGDNRLMVKADGEIGSNKIDEAPRLIPEDSNNKTCTIQ